MSVLRIVMITLLSVAFAGYLVSCSSAPAKSGDATATASKAPSAATARTPVPIDKLGSGINTGFQNAYETDGVKFLPISSFEESENIWVGYDQLTERSVAADAPAPEGHFSNFVFTRGAPQQKLKWVKPAGGHSFGAGPEGEVKHGSQALYWNETTKSSRLVAYNIPRDWTGYRYFTMWVYSEQANMAGAAISIYSDNHVETPDADDYWQTKIIFDFVGWKQIEIPIDSMQITRNPLGWDKIDYIKIASSGFGLTAKKDTVAWFDDLKLTTKSTVVNPLDKITINFPEAKHPLLYGDKAFYAGVKKKAETEDWAKAAFAKVKSGADAIFDPAYAIPDEGGGHYHDVSGKSGSVDVASTHYALAQATQYCGIMYQVTGEKKYADKAKEILLGYAKKYLNYPMRDKYGNVTTRQVANSSRALAQPMNESRWIVYLSAGMDLIWDTLSKDERDNIEINLLRPAANLIMINNEKGHNHQTWCNAGVGAVGFLLQDPKYVKYAIYGTDHGFLYQMRASVNPDGMWYEGSGHYHFLTMEPLTMLSEAAFNNGINLYDTKTVEGRNYQNMFLLPAKYRNPDYQLPLINDGKLVTISDDERARFLEIGYNRYQADASAQVIVPILAKALRSNMHALLYGVAKLPKVDGNKQVSANLGGTAPVLRSADNKLFMTLNGRTYAGGHSHADKLSITSYANGLTLSPDAGSIKYEAPEHKPYFIQTVAHNTVVMDYISQKYVAGSEMVAFSGGPLVQVGWMRESQAYPGSTMERALVMTDWYTFDIFNIKSDAPRLFHWVYRNLGDLKSPAGLTFKPAVFPPVTPATENGYRFLEKAMIAPIQGGFDLVWDMYNDKWMTLRVLDNKTPSTLITANMLQAKPVNDEIDPTRFQGILIGREGAASTNYTVIHAPMVNPKDLKTEVLAAKLGATAPVDSSAGVVKIAKGNLEDTVAYNMAGGAEISAAGIKTDGKYVMVRKNAGKITDAFIVGATMVEIPEGTLKLVREELVLPKGAVKADSVLHIQIGDAELKLLNNTPYANITLQATGVFAPGAKAGEVKTLKVETVPVN